MKTPGQKAYEEYREMLPAAFREDRPAWEGLPSLARYSWELAAKSLNPSQRSAKALEEYAKQVLTETGTVAMEYRPYRKAARIVATAMLRWVGEQEKREELLAKLETFYSFSCEGGPLRNCEDWQKLKELL